MRMAREYNLVIVIGIIVIAIVIAIIVIAIGIIINYYKLYY